MPTTHEYKQARLQGRADRLIVAAERIATKIENDPRNPKAKLWRSKLEEYRVSLDRITSGLPEAGSAIHPRIHKDAGWKKIFRVIKGHKEPGVHVDVPVDEMRMKN